MGTIMAAQRLSNKIVNDQGLEESMHINENSNNAMCAFSVLHY